MHDLRAKTRTITAEGNRFCIITSPLSDFKSQTSWTLLLRHYKLTNVNVSYFLTNQSKTKTFIDLKVTRKPKSNKNSTRPYLNESPVHFTHGVKTKGYEVIRVNVFLRKLMKFLRKKKTEWNIPPPLLSTKLIQCRGRMAKYFISFPHRKNSKHFLKVSFNWN